MKYSLIYADCPWSYNDKATAGKRGAEFKYPCMSTHELYKMSDYINEIADPNSVIYMWTTGPMMPDALGTMRFWGFTYKTVAFTWIKTNKKPISKRLVPFTPLEEQTYLTYNECYDDDGRPWSKETKGDFMGMGNHVRANAEFVLLGVRGKGIKRVNASVRSTVISPIREHSRKPDEVSKRLETLYGDVPRIELFARERFPGWDFHGNEVKF